MTTPPGTIAGRPAPVSTAVKLMYAIAALAIIGALLGLADLGDLRDRVRTASPSLSSSDLDTAVTVSIVVALVIAVVEAVLWVLFAIFTGRGRNWARIVVTVLAALVIISGLTALVNGFQLADVATVLALVCAVGVVVLLFRRESSAWFAAGGSRQEVTDPGYPGYPPVQ
jgi:hypothetical protein